MGIRLTASQKEKARKLFVVDASAWPELSGLAYEFADANKRNQSTDLAGKYYSALKGYHAHLRARLQVVKLRACFVKVC